MFVILPLCLVLKWPWSLKYSGSQPQGSQPESCYSLGRQELLYSSLSGVTTVEMAPQ